MAAPSQPFPIRPSCCGDPVCTLPYEAKRTAGYVASTELKCPSCPFQTFPSEESSTEHSTAGCQSVSQDGNKQKTLCCWSKASGPRRARKSASPICHFIDEKSEAPPLWTGQGGKIRGRNTPQLYVLRSTLDQALEIQVRSWGAPCLEDRPKQRRHPAGEAWDGGQHVAGCGSKNRPLLSGEPGEADGDQGMRSASSTQYLPSWRGEYGAFHLFISDTEPN